MRQSLTWFFCALFLLTMACASTPQKRSFGEVIDDSMLHTRLKARFLADKTIKPGNLDITVRRGVVTMKGVLTTQAEIDRAIEVAERTKGVRQVKAYLVLSEQQDAGVVTTKRPAKDRKTTPDRSLHEEDIAPETKQGSADVPQEEFSDVFLP